MPASTEFVRAGNWIFGTGLRGAANPALFEQLGEKLTAAGSSMSLVARLDQYYPDVRCVAHYQAARKSAFAGRQVAPSTSVIVSGLEDPQAQVEVQVMAATAASGYVPREIDTGLNRPDASGYAPGLRVGDLIFIAGQLARDASGKLAAHGVEAETDYIMRRRLVPALEAAESALDLVLKAQLYVSRPGDLKNFLNAFGGRVPPTTVVAVRHPAFLTPEATVEINLIAAHRSARSRVRDIGSAARALDGLVFVDGLKDLAAAEVYPSKVIRALYFHPGSAELPEASFPYTAIQVDGGPVADIWGYAPSS